MTTYVIEDPYSIPLYTGRKQFNAQITLTLENDSPVQFKISNQPNYEEGNPSDWSYLLKAEDKIGRVITQETCKACYLHVSAIVPSSISIPRLRVEIELNELDGSTDLNDMSHWFLLALGAVFLGFALFMFRRFLNS